MKVPSFKYPKIRESGRFHLVRRAGPAESSAEKEKNTMMYFYCTRFCPAAQAGAAGAEKTRRGGLAKRGRVGVK